MSQRAQSVLFGLLFILWFAVITAMGAEALLGHPRTKAALEECRRQASAPTCRIVPRCVPVPAKPQGSL